MFDNKKWSIFFVIIFVFVLAKNVSADAGPPEPECAQINEKTGQPGCGYLKWSSTLDVSSYGDRFVFLTETEGFQDPSITYTVSNGKYESYRRGMDSAFAVDKSYFQSRGGLSGIFMTKQILAYPYDPSNKTTVASMAPKDEAEYIKHLYHFIISKYDKNLNSYSSDAQLINGQYVGYYGVYADYVATPNLSCTADNCSELVTYTPQAVIDSYIVVAPTKQDFTPANANSPAPYVAPSYEPTPNPEQVNPPTNPQPSIVLPPINPTPTPSPAEHVSWLGKFWQNIKSFFKSVFKK